MIVGINLFANIIVTISVTFFIIGVFGRKSQMIEKMPILEQYFLRLSLSTQNSYIPTKSSVRKV